MSTQAFSYETTYSPEIFVSAARAFRDYQFKRYGPLLYGCCIINALGLGLALWLGATVTDVLFVVFVVVIGPVWLAYKYFLGPQLMAAKLRYVLAPVGRVTVSSSALILPTCQGSSFELPWSMVKSMKEMDELFLLVVSPLSAYFIPKAGMPTEAISTLRERVLANAA